MELRDLRYFIEVVEARSMSRAAARLNVAQPGLSRQMQELERELKVTLLARHPKGVEPSLAGDALARGAKDLLADLSRAVSRAETVHEGRRGRVVLGATLAAIASGLPATVEEELRRERPEIELVVKDYDPPHATERLREGAVDVAMTWPDAMDAGLQAEPLWEEVLERASIPAGHPLASRARLRVPDLGELPFLLPRGALSAQLSAAMLDALRDAGMRSPLAVLDGDIRAAHLDIAAGRGWLLLSRSRTSSPPAGTATVRLEGFRFAFDAVALWRRGEHRPVVRTVLEKMLEVARRHPAQKVSARPKLPPVPARRRARPEGYLPPGLDLRHLRALLEVAAEQTIGRAAERLGVTQSAVSRQLRELEEMLGLRLLERSARGVALAPAGASLAGDSPAVLRALDGLIQETTRARRGMEGRCVLGAVATVASSELLGRMVVACAARHPHVRLVITEIATPHQPHALARGDIDLGLAHAYPALPPEAGLRRERVHEDRLQTALLSAGHRLAGRKQLTAVDLADVPFLFMERSFHPPFYDRAMAALQDIGLKPRVEATYDGLQVVWSLAAQGKGWAFGFRSHVKRPPAGTVAIPIVGLDLPWGLDLLRRKAEPSLAVRSVVQVIRDVARLGAEAGGRLAVPVRRAAAGTWRRRTGS